MTSKERAGLRRQANALEVVLHIGKSGIIDTLTEQTDGVLRTRELVKARVLESAPEDVGTIAKELARRTNAEVVQVIGRVFVLYRYNPELHEAK